jgi:uncharacterized protein (TIGR02594 family)
MALPARYADLKKEGAPKILIEALKLYGVLETPGTASNPRIMAWADEIGGSVEEAYLSDDIAWCGLFVAVVCKRADKPVISNPLWALSWSAWGVPKKTPELGDVLVFTRKGGGHVGFYVGEDEMAYHVLGGNQDNAVSIKRIEKKRLYCARTPLWKIAKPSNVRRIWRAATGKPSENEA